MPMTERNRSSKARTTLPHAQRVLRALRVIVVAATALVLPALVGCGTEGPTSIVIDASDYDRAFDATLDVLRRARFPIERVDAARGVIATGEKRTAGLATPWDREQRTLGQAWQDFMNDQGRTVRVTFAPEPSMPTRQTPPTGAHADRGEQAERHASDTPIRLTVTSTIRRHARPNVRTETEAVGLTTIAVDDKLARLGTYRPPSAPLRDDEPHAQALVAAIIETMQRQRDEPMAETAAADTVARPS